MTELVGVYGGSMVGVVVLYLVMYLRMVLMPSSCGMLVYKEVTSAVTK